VEFYRKFGFKRTKGWMKLRLRYAENKRAQLT
jgi:hypothetical protein